MSSSKSSLTTEIGPQPEWFRTLRAQIVSRMQSHPLTVAGASGDRSAVAAYLHFFWPFVHAFPGIIDRQCRRHSVAIAQAIGSKNILKEAIAQLAKMRREEGLHADHWIALGTSIGVLMPTDTDPVAPEIVHLVDKMRSSSAAGLFIDLCVTEIIAYAISDAALRSPALSDLDSRWFHEHVEHESPGHEDIDRWLALRLLAMESSEKIENRFRIEAIATLNLFVAATDKAMAMR